MSKSNDKPPFAALQHLGGPANSTALICLPYAGGGVSTYRSWPLRVPSISVYAMSVPGRDARLFDPLFTTLESLVASIVEAVRPLTGRPFALFGHSMGGLVAYEVARLLRKKGSAAPVHLFVSAIRAAHLPDPNPRIFDLPDKRFIQQLRWFGANTLLEEEGGAEILDLMLPTLRADFRIVQTYRYRSEPPLACPITVFGAMQDNTTSEQELKEWRQHTSSFFDLVMLPGGHNYLDSTGEAVQAHIRSRLAGGA